MNTFEKMKKELKEYKNTLVLDFLTTVILRDIEEDEYDYYYVYENLDWDVYSVSAIVGFTPLKGRLKEEEYKRIENWWNMNTSWDLTNNDCKIEEKENEMIISWKINWINNNWVYRKIKEKINRNEKIKITDKLKDNESKKELKEILETIKMEKEYEEQ